MMAMVTNPGAGLPVFHSPETLAGRDSCQMFTLGFTGLKRPQRQASCINAAKIALSASSVKNCDCACTKSWHPPVDELHSAENTVDRSAKKLLTSKIALVKTHSFFDSF